MKHILPILLITLTLPSCTTDAAGNKTFLGLNAPAWLGVGEDAAKAAAQGGIIGYGSRRAVVELTSGK